MWMNDYEYEFKKDSAEKKNIARSARSTRTHCGKRGAVRLPSDNLTKKELKAMNGECIEYASLKKPMTFAEFKQLPKDLRKAYLEYIDELFDMPPYTEIGNMFGIAGNTLCLYATDCGVNRGKGKVNRKWKKDEFYAWVSGADMEAPVAPVTGEDVDILPGEDAETDNAFTNVSDKQSKGFHGDIIGDSVYIPSTAVPVNGNMTFESNANSALDTMRMLLANKKVKMTVLWELMDD